MGYTTGVLRHYFKDKDELLLFAKNMLFDRTRERASIAASHADGLEKLLAMVFEFLPADNEAIDNVRLLAMFNGNAVGDPRLRRLQHKRNESHAALLAGVIEDLQKERILRADLEPLFEASAIMALIDGLGEQQIMRPTRWTRGVLISLVSRYISGLARRS
jgi:AcrR family transcriptional regulator